MPNLAALMNSIRRGWAALTSAKIRHACASFRRRLEAVVAANGAFIE